jgi:hypothetical protein
MEITNVQWMIKYAPLSYAAVSVARIRKSRSLAASPKVTHFNENGINKLHVELNPTL